MPARRSGGAGVAPGHDANEVPDQLPCLMVYRLDDDSSIVTWTPLPLARSSSAGSPPVFPPLFPRQFVVFERNGKKVKGNIKG